MGKTNNPDLKHIIVKHFDSYATNWDQRLKHHCYMTRFRTVKAMLPKIINDVADLGCGTGDYSAIFDGSVNYIGIDNSEEMINRARGLYHGRKFIVGDVDGLDIPENSMDCVLAIGLFEYLEDPSILAGEICRITKTNGKIICSFPNKNNKLKNQISYFTKCIRLVQKVAHLFYKRDNGNQNPLAPKGYVKDDRIVHRKYDEVLVLKLFNSGRFVHSQTKYANFRVFSYFIGLSIMKRLDEITSTFISVCGLDKLFSNYGSILLMSFIKRP